VLFLFNCQEDNPGIISKAVLIGIQDNATLVLSVCLDTVPIKSKLTLETRASKRSRIESRVSSLESRVSSSEDRETRLSRICKNSKGFRGNDLFLEENCTAQVFRVDRYRVETFNHALIVD